MIKIRREISLSSLKNIEEFQITSIINEKWLNRKITHPLTQKPGLALAGYLKYLSKGSLQVFGKTEVGFLNQLSEKECRERLTTFLSAKIPGIIISENQHLNKSIAEIVNKSRTSILISSLKSSLVISRTSSFLFRHFAKKVRINGVLMDIMGQGVLIRGKSGVGKSETAIELIKKGHQLISDDLIEFYLNHNEEPVGRFIEKIKKWIEVRGLGIINIVDMFGFGALMEEKKLDLVIELENWDPKKEYDRLGEENLYFQVLGKDIPMFKLPVTMGRNLSTLIEIAVKYFISRESGSESFMDQIKKKNEKN